MCRVMLQHAKQMAPVQCDGNTCWVDVDGLGRCAALYDFSFINSADIDKLTDRKTLNKR